MSVGVVIGRFQVDKPHEGHRQLLEKAKAKHGKVLVLLGCSPVRMSRTDPLDYQTRERMRRGYFPWATFAPIYDKADDHEWSRQVDRIVHEMFPTDNAVLYGSRASFLPHYHGAIQVRELDEVTAPSGTLLREALAVQVSDAPEFRHGVIYAAANRYPVSYQAVDIAVINPDWGGGRAVLLVKKPGEEQYRFPGGFVATRDATLEAAADRELREETRIEAGQYQYRGSFRIDDWRYRGREDKIMTAFFTARYIFGALKASDDVVDAKWCDHTVVTSVIVREHLILATLLRGILPTMTFEEV